MSAGKLLNVWEAHAILYYVPDRTVWERRRWAARVAALAVVWSLTGVCGLLWGTVHTIRARILEPDGRFLAEIKSQFSCTRSSEL